MNDDNEFMKAEAELVFDNARKKIVDDINNL